MGFENDYEKFHHKCEGLDNMAVELHHAFQNKVDEIKNTTNKQDEINRLTEKYKKDLQKIVDKKEAMRKKVFKN